MEGRERSPLRGGRRAERASEFAGASVMVLVRASEPDAARVVGWAHAAGVDVHPSVLTPSEAWQFGAVAAHDVFVVCVPSARSHPARRDAGPHDGHAVAFVAWTHPARGVGRPRRWCGWMLNGRLARRTFLAGLGACRRLPGAVAHTATAGFRPRASLPLERLTPREREVVTSLQATARVRHVAASLGISVHTARNHLKAVYRKLRVSSQGELLAALRASSDTGPAPVQTSTAARVTGRRRG